MQAGAERQRKKLLSSANIVGLTCCSAALPALDEQVFDITVLDEGSQITEPLALVPITRAKSRYGGHAGLVWLSTMLHFLAHPRWGVMH